MANKKVTDLTAITTAPVSGVMHFIDTTDTSQNAAGSSFKVTKADFLKENTAAILLNTAKVGITSGQASAITVNTAKVGYTDALVAAAPSVVLNTAKVGITPSQTSAITANTSKVGYTEALVNANTSVVSNTAKVGITTTQAAAITANSSKVGYTDALVALAPTVVANTAKVGITSSQAAAILFNTNETNDLQSDLLSKLRYSKNDLEDQVFYDSFGRKALSIGKDNEINLFDKIGTKISLKSVLTSLQTQVTKASTVNSQTPALRYSKNDLEDQVFYDGFGRKALSIGKDNEINLFDKIGVQTKLKERLTGKVILWMPNKVLMLHATNLQLFKCGMLNAYNTSNFMLDTVKVSSVSGLYQGFNLDYRYDYLVNATTNANFVLKFRAYNDQMGFISAANDTQMIHVTKKTSPSTNETLLSIGDSFTDANIWPAELQRMLNGTGGTPAGDGISNLTFIGTKDTGTASPNEGYNGKYYNWFNSSASPFWNPNTNVIDFTYYCAQNGFTKIDNAIILLGTNGGLSNGFNTIADIQFTWNKLIAHNANVKVVVSGKCWAVPYGSGNAGIGEGQTWISLNANTIAYNSALQALAESAAYQNNFIFVDINTQMDNLSNMPQSVVPANQRNATATIKIGTDNVHPATSGFLQIADVFRAAVHYWFLS